MTAETGCPERVGIGEEDCGYRGRGAQRDMETIARLILGYRGAKVLFTAARLGVFDTLDEGPKSLDALCASRGASRRTMGALMDALAALGIVDKTANRYVNGDVARRHLTAASGGSLLNVLKMQDMLWGAWGDLEEVVLSGKPKLGLVERLKKEPGFLQEYIRSMYAISQEPAKEVARLAAAPKAARLLDVGGGPGAYSEAFLRRYANLRADLLDLPETLEVARTLSGRSEVSHRLRFLPGDYRAMEPERASYDLVLLSNVTHDEGEAACKSMIRASRRALRPGGKLLLHDFMTEGNGTGPLFAALFSVHVGVYTEEGRTYSQEEYAQWLKDEGFSSVRVHPVAEGAPNASRLLAAELDA